MRRAEVLARVRSLELPANDYVVHMSAALVLMGVLEKARDIDLLARGPAWEAAKQLGILSRGSEDELVQVGDDVEVWGGWYGAEVSSLIEAAQLVHGIPCVPLAEIKRAKEELGRPKDALHLAAIRAHLGRMSG